MTEPRFYEISNYDKTVGTHNLMPESQTYEISNLDKSVGSRVPKTSHTYENMKTAGCDLQSAVSFQA